MSYHFSADSMYNSVLHSDPGLVPAILLTVRLVGFAAGGLQDPVVLLLCPTYCLQVVGWG